MLISVDSHGEFSGFHEDKSTYFISSRVSLVRPLSEMHQNGSSTSFGLTGNSVLCVHLRTFFYGLLKIQENLGWS